MFELLMALMVFVVLAMLVYLYANFGPNDVLFLYVVMFAPFVAFRSLAIYWGVDDVFPESIYFGDISQGDFVTGAMLLFIYFLVLAAAAFIGRNHSFANKVDLVVDYNVCLYAVVYLFVVSTLYFIYCYYVAGSFSNIVFVARIDKEVGFGFLRPAVSGGVLFAAILLSLRFNLFALSVYSLMVFYNVGMGDRSGVVYSLLVFFSVWAVKGKRIDWRKVPLVVLGVVASFLASVVTKNMRTENIGGEVSEGFVRQLSSGLNLNVVDAYYMSISYLGDVYGYRMGYDIWLGIIGVVPRFLWPGKPEVIDTGTWFAQLFTDWKMGTPITALGEWYINFSYVGVVLCALVTYLWCRFFNDVFRFGKVDVAIKLSFVLLVVQTGFSNTSLRDFIMFFLYFIFPLWLFSRFWGRSENTYSK